MIRFPPRHNSGTRARRTTRGSCATVGTASISSSMDAIGLATGAAPPTRYPARQTREASEAIARRHGLAAARTVFAQQSPDAIDAGVFHNDVISVGAGKLLFCHARAYVDQARVLESLERQWGPASRPSSSTKPKSRWKNRSTAICSTVAAATSRRTLVAARARRCAGASACQRIPRPPGGVGRPDRRGHHARPAPEHAQRRRSCLPADARSARRCGTSEIAARVLLDGGLADELERWILRHYRDRLAPPDLADPNLLDESRCALDELTTLLRLPVVFDFQR